MKCPDCGGTGESARPGVPCFTCDGTGEMCDVCGESIEACLCGEDDDEQDAD